MTKSGFMVGLGETAAEVEQLLRRSARAGCRCRDHRAISAAHAAQSAGRRIRHARTVRALPRFRPLARIQNGLQRTAGAQFLYGRSGERAGCARVILNWILAFALGRAAGSACSRVSASCGWLPLRLRLCWSPARGKRGWQWRFALGYAAGIAYWFGLCNWIQWTLAHHAGVSSAAAWLLFLLLCLAKALQMGDLRGAGRPAYCDPLWRCPPLRPSGSRSNGRIPTRASSGSIWAMPAAICLFRCGWLHSPESGACRSYSL